MADLFKHRVYPYDAVFSIFGDELPHPQLSRALLEQARERRHVSEKLYGRIVLSKVTGCWVSSHRRNHQGYVPYGGNGGHLLHRVLYESVVRGFEPDEQADHHCRQRACFNPQHIEAVTPGQNTQRMVKAQTLERQLITAEPFGDALFEERRWLQNLISGVVRAVICTAEGPYTIVNGDDGPFGERVTDPALSIVRSPAPKPPETNSRRVIAAAGMNGQDPLF